MNLNQVHLKNVKMKGRRLKHSGIRYLSERSIASCARQAPCAVLRDQCTEYTRYAMDHTNRSRLKDVCVTVK